MIGIIRLTFFCCYNWHYLRFGRPACGCVLPTHAAVFDSRPPPQGSLSHGLEAGLLGMKRDGRRVVVLPPARSDSPPQACVYLVDLCKVKREVSTPPLPGEWRVCVGLEAPG